MTKKLSIGVDLDGVLAAFNEAFIELIHKRTGRQLPTVSDSYPDTWNYHRAAGVTREEESALWKEITEGLFWAQLLPREGALEAIRQLDDLSMFGHDVYFITSRPGTRAKRHSEFWLQKHGMEYPTVLISSEKGHVARGLGLDIFIDDKPENVADVIVATTRPGKLSSVRSYLLDAPYNRSVDMRLASTVTRVSSVTEMLVRENLIYDERKAA